MIPVKKKWIALILLGGVIMLNWGNAFWILSTGLLVVAISYPAAFHPFRYVKFWSLFLIILFIFPFFTGTQDAEIFGISYSVERLQQTVVMMVRSILIFLIMQVLTYKLQVRQLRSFFKRIGLLQFEETAGQSLEFMPKIKSIILSRIKSGKPGLKPGSYFRTGYNLAIDLIVDMFKLVTSDYSYTGRTCDEILNDLAGLKLDSKQIIVIIGDEHVGKTTCLKNIIDLYKSLDYKVGGILSPGEMLDDRKAQILAVNVQTDEKRILAESEEFQTEIIIGKYYFHEEVLHWCNQILNGCINNNVTLIDEFGPLELNGGGFESGFENWIQNGAGILILTLRPSLRELFHEFLQSRLSDQLQPVYYKLVRPAG